MLIFIQYLIIWLLLYNECVCVRIYTYLYVHSIYVEAVRSRKREMGGDVGDEM